MYTVTKGERRQRVATDTQLAAFVNAGWKQEGDAPLSEEGEPPSEEEESYSEEGKRTLCDDKACEDALRDEAASLGLKPHWNAKSETIQKMIDEAKSAG